MLRVVALVVLVATTVRGVEVEEYTQEAYTALGLIDPEQAITVTPLNADNEVQLRIMEERFDNAATFELHPISVLNDDVDLGMKLSDQEVYFDISFFGISVRSSEEREKVSLSLHLLLDHYDPDLELDPIFFEMPVFMIPHELMDVENYNQFYFRKWAFEQKVGVISRNFEDALTIALQTGEFSTDFLWLEELLSYEVYPSKKNYFVGDEEVTTYVSRPIVVSEDTRDLLVKIVNKFKSNEGTVD